MEDAYDELAERVMAGFLSSKSRGDTSRYVVGVAGPPGSGKSTLANEVVRRLKSLKDIMQSPEIAVVVPMDGFHYYRKELDSMPDHKEAYARRGAFWTFNAAAYVECVAAVKHRAQEVLEAPSFEHGVGDPVEGGITILPNHSIVISEGNYLLLGRVQ